LKDTACTSHGSSSSIACAVMYCLHDVRSHQLARTHTAHA
jgi:hypothetical protein